MISPEDAKKIKASPEWTLIEEHLRECVAAIDCVSDIGDDQNHEVIARGKKGTIELVKSILAPLEIEDLMEEDLRSGMLHKLGLDLPRKKEE